MKLCDYNRRKHWERRYNGSPLQMWANSHTKKTAELERRVTQLDKQLDIDPLDEDLDDTAKEIMDIFFGHGERPMHDEDFYNLYAAEVIQKAYIKTETVIIKLASSHKNVLHIKICRTEQERARIEQVDKFGFVISHSQARAFIYEVFKVMKSATEISHFGFDESALTDGIRITVPDASDLTPFVRILEENKEMLAETIQWKHDSR